MRNKPHAFLILCVLWKIEVIIILLFCCMVEMAERIWCYFSSGGDFIFSYIYIGSKLGSTLLFLILNRMRCWTKKVPQMAIPSSPSELISIHIYPSFPYLLLCPKWDERHMFWLRKKDIPHHDQQAPDSETNCKWNYEMKIEFTRIISSW